MIIRNISFNAAPSDLTALLVEKGTREKDGQLLWPMVGVPHFPKPRAQLQTSEQKHEQTHRGFGFVQFACREDAQAAIDACNGQNVKGRPVAVDFALSKEDFVKATVAEAEAEAGIEDDEDESGSGSGSEDGSEDGSGDEDDSEEDDGEDRDDYDDEDEDEEGKKDDGKRKDVGFTVFVRNVSYETSDSDLYELFRKYGPVRYARIVKDRESGRPMGTAFVCYYTEDGMERALKRADAATGQGDDPADEGDDDRGGATGGGIMLQGRALNVCQALNRAGADKAVKKRGKKHDKADKRNIFLATEGQVRTHFNEEGEPVMPTKDIDKRNRAEREKKEKLANPNFFVSPVRLSIRNLSLEADKKALRRIILKGVKQGMARGLVDDLKPEDMGGEGVHGVGGLADDYNEDLLPASGREWKKVVLEQCKVIYDDVETSKDNKALSKGYGFVEFKEHVHALAALRELNNNPLPEYAQYAQVRKGALHNGTPAERSRLIIEFAIENVKKVKIYEARKKVWDERQEEKAADDKINGEDAGLTAKQKRLKKKEARKAERKQRKDRFKRKRERERTEAGEGAKGGAGEGEEVSAGGAYVMSKQRREEAEKVAAGAAQDGGDDMLGEDGGEGEAASKRSVKRAKERQKEEVEKKRAMGRAGGKARNEEERLDLLTEAHERRTVMKQQSQAAKKVAKGGKAGEGEKAAKRGKAAKARKGGAEADGEEEVRVAKVAKGAKGTKGAKGKGGKKNARDADEDGVGGEGGQEEPDAKRPKKRWFE